MRFCCALWDLSYSLFFLTHIVALDTFIVLLSYLMLVIYISVSVAHFVDGDKIYIDYRVRATP